MWCVLSCSTFWLCKWGWKTTGHSATIVVKVFVCCGQYTAGLGDDT